MERIVEIETFSMDEESSEVTLRPDAWNEYIGQEQILQKYVGSTIVDIYVRAENWKLGIMEFFSSIPAVILGREDDRGQISPGDRKPFSPGA